jgi:SAM-dependent methyltransferase
MRGGVVEKHRGEEIVKLDAIQNAAAEQFGRQSHRYGKGHILADISDVAAALKRIPLSPPARVLDVATGAGHTGLHCASLGHEVVCADIAQPMLDRVNESARERGLEVETRRHPAEALPYEDARFDLVTSRVAPHHFSSPQAFVEETARVLRPGGHFMLIDGSIEDGDPVAEEWTHQVEHNFGHGQRHLASLLATMDLLAFGMHTLLELADESYRLIRAAVGPRRRFFQHLEALTTYWHFESWERLMDFMMRELEIGPYAVEKS